MDGFSENVIYYHSEKKIPWMAVMKPGLVGHTCDPIILEAAAGGLGF